MVADVDKHGILLSACVHTHNHVGQALSDRGIEADAEISPFVSSVFNQMLNSWHLRQVCTPANGQDVTPDFSTKLSLIFPRILNAFQLIPTKLILAELHPLTLCQLVYEEFTDAEGRQARPITTDPRTGKLTLSLPAGVTSPTDEGRNALRQLGSIISKLAFSRETRQFRCHDQKIAVFDPHAYVVLVDEPGKSLLHLAIKA